MCPSVSDCSGGYHSFGPWEATHIRSHALTRPCLAAGAVDVPMPFADDFDCCGPSGTLDASRWTEVDRVECSYHRLEIRVGRGYAGYLQFDTVRTRPMLLRGPAMISSRVCQNTVPAGHSPKIECFETAT